MTNLPLTIKETQDGLKSKKFSAVELVDIYLAQIKKYNSEYNIFLTVTEGEAYKKAKEVDKLISNLNVFEKFPLLGVSFAFKDLFCTEGIRTTAGSKVLDNYIPVYSGTFVTRVQNAGSITLGKTNQDAWGHGSSGENSDFGPTKNPWNKEYVPGGSSSGSGAALASNMALISTGTDTGSSVRMPASYCNLVGLKPTYGAVSRYGVIAMASSLDSVGHMARSVEDVEKVFNVVKGVDGKDSTVTNGIWATSKSKPKIGIPKEYFMKGINVEVENTLITAINTYKKLGIEMIEVSLPHTKYAIDVYYIIQPAEVSSNLGRFDGIRYGNSRDSFGSEAKRRIMLGSYVLSAGYYDAFYEKAQKVRTLLVEDFDKVFESVDALIAPISPMPPFKLGEKTNDPLQMYLADIFTVSANLVGIPSLALPSTFSKSGLPIGFQLMGPRFSENTLFELGKKYHQEIDYKPRTAL